MMTSFVCFSWMVIVTHLFCLMNFRRNRISFDFFVLFVLTNLKGSVGLILAKVSVMWIPSPLTFPLGLLYHCLVSFVVDVPHRF
jgi:hypothetical protein